MGAIIWRNKIIPKHLEASTENQALNSIGLLNLPLFIPEVPSCMWAPFCICIKWNSTTNTFYIEKSYLIYGLSKALTPTGHSSCTGSFREAVKRKLVVQRTLLSPELSSQHISQVIHSRTNTNLSFQAMERSGGKKKEERKRKKNSLRIVCKHCPFSIQ